MSLSSAPPSSVPEMPQGYEIKFDYSDSAQLLALAEGDGLTDPNVPLRFVFWWQDGVEHEGWRSVSPNHQRVKTLADIDHLIRWLNSNYPKGAQM